jgi:hypothetical protein
MSWGGSTHYVLPENLYDLKALTNPSFEVIPSDAVFAVNVTLTGETVNLGGTNVYANVLLDASVKNLINEGGTFFGNITGSIGSTVELILAGGIGTGAYTNGPDGDDDVTNGVVGTTRWASRSSGVAISVSTRISTT